MIFSGAVILKTMLAFLLLVSNSNVSNALISPFGHVSRTKSLSDVKGEVKTAPSLNDVHKLTKTKLFLADSTRSLGSDVVSGKRTSKYDINYENFVGNIPIFRLHITESYVLAPSMQRYEMLKEWITKNRLSDVWFVSHGWQTSVDDAFSKKYEPLFKSFDDLVQQSPLERRKFGIVGITWNSVTRNTEEDLKTIFAYERKAKRLTTDSDLEISRETYEAARENLKQDFISSFGNTDYEESFQQWLEAEIEQEETGVQGDTKDSQLFFRFMKGRAAQSGLRILSRVVNDLRGVFKLLRIHLVGHNVGALLVSAAANRGQLGTVTSLTLLQGAFNENSFSPTIVYATFRGMLQFVTTTQTVRGPITNTYLKNDKFLNGFYYSAANIIEDKAFYGAEIPSPYSGKKESEVDSLAPNSLHAIGRMGISMVDDQTKNWNSLAAFDPKNLGNKNFQNIDASDAIKDHDDVWKEAIAELLYKIAQATR